MYAYTPDTLCGKHKNGRGRGRPSCGQNCRGRGGTHRGGHHQIETRQNEMAGGLQHRRPEFGCDVPESRDNLNDNSRVNTEGTQETDVTIEDYMK